MEKVRTALDEIFFLGIEPDSLGVYRAYFDRDNIKVLHVARPGDHVGALGTHPDMLKQIAKDRAKIREQPNRYVLIPTYSSNMAYNDMLDFANLQEPELMNKLLHVLSQPRPFAGFLGIVSENSELRNQWEGYKIKQKYDFIKEWANENNITVFDKFLA